MPTAQCNAPTMYRGMYVWSGAVIMVAALGHAAAAQTVDLLHVAPSTVAVSSTVANQRFVPAHLVDGDPATAWNSRTGDLDGAWIAFRVPAEAHVSAIEMTVGFTRVDKQGDLFTMNPRIKRVRLYRNGAVVREQALDPELRGAQSIAVDTAGGEFKIEIVEMLPGSRRNWREACVSELRVLGTLPAGQQPVVSTPIVRVGALDAPAPSPAPASTPAPAAPPRVLLAVQTTAATAVVIGAAPDAYIGQGAPVVLDRAMPDIPSTSAPQRRDVVAMQPIAATAEQRAAWIGRKLTLHGKAGAVCDGVISGLAVVTSTPAWTVDAPVDAAAFASAFWAQGRHHDRMLVAVVSPVAGASCSGALWGQDPAIRVVRGRIEARRYRIPLFDRYFAPNGDFTRLRESYALNDLNGEYESASENEQRIPVDERLTEDLVRRTFHTFAACDAGDDCIGMVAGSYHTHHVRSAAVIDHGEISSTLDACGFSIGAPIAAADVDGDGEVDLIYMVELYPSGTGIGVFGRRQTASAALREAPCWSVP